MKRCESCSKELYEDNTVHLADVDLCKKCYEEMKGEKREMTMIKVIYKESPIGEIGIDPELDKKMQSFFESLGFKRTGQGFDIQKQERDIGFESEEYRLCSPPLSKHEEGNNQ